MVADQTIRDADANAQGSTTMADLMAGLPPLLLGTYTPKIDAKGRMALPAKFRSQLGQGLVMARGQERCVYLLPFDEFRRIASQIQRVSVGNKAAREYLRVFLSGAVDQQPDKQGRVLVPPVLREFAKLERDAYWVGAMKTMEIWSKTAWLELVEPAREKVDESVLAKLGELGI